MFNNQISRRIIVTIMGILFVCSVNANAENLVLNPSFEDSTNEVPAGWKFNFQAWTGAKGKINLDVSTSHSGKCSATITQNNDKGKMSISTQLISVDGSVFQLSCWMKTNFVEGSNSVAYFTVNGYKHNKFVKELANTKIIKVSTDWTQYKATIKPPNNINGLIIAANIIGQGTIWIDDISLKLEKKTESK